MATACPTGPQNQDLLEPLSVQGRRNLHRLCMSMSRDWDAAEDIVQEAACCILLGADQFRGESKPSTWLHTVVRNAFLNYVRTEERKMGCWTNLDELIPHEAPRNSSDPDAILETKMYNAKMVRSLMKFIDEQKDSKSFPDKLHKIWLWSNDIAPETIAEIFNVNPTSVRTGIFKFKEELKPLAATVTPREVTDTLCHLNDWPLGAEPCLSMALETACKVRGVTLPSIESLLAKAKPKAEIIPINRGKPAGSAPVPAIGA